MMRQQQPQQFCCMQGCGNGIEANQAQAAVIHHLICTPMAGREAVIRAAFFGQLDPIAGQICRVLLKSEPLVAYLSWMPPRYQVMTQAVAAV